MNKNVRSARLSLAYGPGTKPGDTRVLNSFIEKGINGKIEMIDQGKATRTYCYISDAIEIMWDILLFGKEPIYNVGGFSTTTIASLAKKIGKTLNTKVMIPKKDNALTGSPQNVRLDMSKVSKEFNKKRTDYIPLEIGLAKTIEWQKEIYKIK
jgi:nucleoside-diphosphate-sugar epimerase